MTTIPEPATELAPARRAGGVGSLVLFLFLSLTAEEFEAKKAEILGPGNSG